MLEKESCAPARLRGQTAQPLAVAFVERRNRSPRVEPQHVAQPMALRQVERDRRALGQRLRDVKSCRGVLGQMRLLVIAAGLSQPSRRVKISP